MLSDIAPQGLFIAAKLSPESEHTLHAYAKSLNLPEVIAKDKLHVTIMYSKVNPKVPYPLMQGDMMIPMTSRKLVYIGKALALTLYSPWLQWRRDVAVACGLRSSFGSYLCHVSLAYNPPMHMILQDYPKPPEDLWAISEYTEALKPKGI